MARWEERTLDIRGLKLRWPRLLSLVGDHLAIVDGRRQIIVLGHMRDGQARLRAFEALPWGPHAVTLSPSGAYLLLASAVGNFYTVWSVDTKTVVLELAGPEPFPAAIGGLGGRDVVVAQREPGRLEAIQLSTGERLFDATTGEGAPYVMTQLSARDAERWLGVCHARGDLDEEGVSFPLEDVEVDPDTLPTWVQQGRLGRGQRVVVGGSPTSDVAVVLQPDKAKRELRDVTVVVGPARWTVPSEYPVLAVQAAHGGVVLATSEAVELWPEGGGERIHALATRGWSLEPATGRASVILTTGELRVLRLVA